MEDWNSWKSMYRIGHGGGWFLLINKKTGKTVLKRPHFDEVVRAAKSYHAHEMKKIDEILLPNK